MKKKRTNLQIFSLALFVIIVLAGIFLYVSFRSHTIGKETLLKLYYYDPIGKELVPVQEKIVLPENSTLAVEKVVDALKNPPKKNLFPLLNSNTVVRSVSVKNHLCTIDLNNESTKFVELSVRKEAIRVYGLVNSITELPGINSVQILIDGKKKTYFNHYLRIDTPLSHYSGILPMGREVFLYFPDSMENNLLLEKREVVSHSDPVVLAKEIVRELFYGSLKGLPGLLPVDTKINDFYIRSGGTAVIDFSSDILKHPLGTHNESLAVLSLVNSLTELPDITSVQILIDGKIIPTLFGSVDISHPIKRFFGLTEENDTIIPYYVYNNNGEQFFTPSVETIHSKDRIKTLFEFLKNPEEGYNTYIPKDSKLIDYKVKDFVLTMSITVPGNADIDDIKQQIMLSYTEFPSVKRIQLTINGKVFLLER